MQERKRKKLNRMSETMLLKIDQEFKNLIPPLTHEDKVGLENNIKANGCETPITVWGGTIIDGHNRYDICIANGIPFEIKEMSFVDRDDAKIWAIRHELEWKGRKITPYIRSSLALKMEEIYKAKAKAHQIRTNENRVMPILAKQEEPINTRKELAKLADVSHGTLDKVKHIEARATPEVKKELEKGTISINEAYIEVRKQENQKREEEARKQRKLELETQEEERKKQREIDLEDNYKQNVLDEDGLDSELDRYNPNLETKEPENTCTYNPTSILDKIILCPCGCGYGVYNVFATDKDKWYSKEEIDNIKRLNT